MDQVFRPEQSEAAAPAATPTSASLSVEHLDSGRIAIGGREASGRSIHVPPEKRGVGMMFQDYALFPHLSVIKNVTFGLRALGSAEARTVAENALDHVGLRDRARDYPHMLSGGEQQRVALARALAPRPHVLLMDEPFSNLDRRTRVMVREDTTAVLRRSGATVILVTHDQDDAMRMADRILMMQGGRVIQDGMAADLYKHPSSLAVARFFAEYNEIQAVCRDGIASTPVGDFPAPDIGEGKPVVVCIRPTGVRLVGRSAGGRTCRVLSRHFLGETELLHLIVEGLPQPLRVTAPHYNTAEPGQAVAFEVARPEVLVFPAT